MSQPITSTDAKTAATTFVNSGNYKDHFKNDGKPIRGYFFTKKDLRDLLTDDNTGIFIQWALPDAKKNVEIILSGMKNNKVDNDGTPSRIISSGAPMKSSLTLGNGTDITGDQCTILIDDDGTFICLPNTISPRIKELISAQHLSVMMSDHLNNNFPNCLYDAAGKKMKGYILNKEAVNDLDINSGAETDKFLFMPVIRKYASGSDRIPLLKPYISVAIAKITGSTLGNIILEYISPCPNNCPDNIDDLYV